MKAITLWQPWASLVAIGAKRLETRAWSTSYRGRVAIHASKRFPVVARNLAEEEPFWSVLRPHRLHRFNLPLGQVLAVARLVAVREIVALSGNRRALGGDPEALHVGMRTADLAPVGVLELAFGDFTPGRAAWVLEDVVQLETPIPARGAQGLWDWTPPATDPVVVMTNDAERSVR